MEHKPIVIGITGHPASGKDTVADYLVSSGFLKISGGDILRDQMIELGLPTDRSHVSEYARRAREEKGNGYLAQGMVTKISGNTVISGIRNMTEVSVFRDNLGERFRLVGVETPLEVRYERAQERGRVGDNISLEQFKLEDEKERSSVSGSHEVSIVIESADKVIQNDGTMEDLYKKVDDFLKTLG